MDSIAESLNQSLWQLEEECQRLPANSTQDLVFLCEDLVNGSERYRPHVAVDFASLGGRREGGGALWLDELLTVLKNETIATANDGRFVAYLDRLVRGNFVMAWF